MTTSLFYLSWTACTWSLGRRESPSLLLIYAYMKEREKTRHLLLAVSLVDFFLCRRYIRSKCLSFVHGVAIHATRHCRAVRFSLEYLSSSSVTSCSIFFRRFSSGFDSLSSFFSYKVRVELLFPLHSSRLCSLSS